MTSPTDIKYSVPTGSKGDGSGGGGMESYPTAAQLQKQKVDAKLQFQEYLKNMNYRIRAVELAAQFKSDDPMKLAREIYKFLSDTEV